MFIGHFGVALAAKKIAPRTSLGTLILAAQFLDFLWPAFLLLGIEHVRIVPGISVVSPLEFTDYPISHSLLMALVWAVLFGGTYYMLRGYARGAWVVAAAVLSHWVLDFIVHRPDLQLLPGVRLRVGLGLWNSFFASVAVETLFFGVGLWIYLSCTRGRDQVANPTDGRGCAHRFSDSHSQPRGRQHRIAGRHAPERGQASPYGYSEG